MTDITSITFALDPANIPSFLLDWEITKLCNLDCSYCRVGPIDGGHDNTTQHPPLDECLKSIDFMYEYVDLYMQRIKPSHRKVVLNIYGGESLFHPDIVEILEACREKYKKYSDNWHLTVTSTTNGVIGSSIWESIIPLVDEFTVSYHTECSPHQHQMYVNNILRLKSAGKRFKCFILMNNIPEKFIQAEKMIDFCEENGINYIPKPLDNQYGDMRWQYTTEQFAVLKGHWAKKTRGPAKEDYNKQMGDVGTTEKIQSIRSGRPCCGGRQLSVNGDLKNSLRFVPAQDFRGWSCGVNWFFLFVRQVTGHVFTNKDCQISTNTGKREPLGVLSDTNAILSTLRSQFETNEVPVITCVNPICMCGFCAPKTKEPEEFNKLLGRFLVK